MKLHGVRRGEVALLSPEEVESPKSWARASYQPAGKSTRVDAGGDSPVPRSSEAPAVLRGSETAGSEAGMSVEMLGPRSKQGPQDFSVRTAEQGRGGRSPPRTRCRAELEHRQQVKAGPQRTHSRMLPAWWHRPHRVKCPIAQRSPGDGVLVLCGSAKLHGLKGGGRVTLLLPAPS